MAAPSLSIGYSPSTGPVDGATPEDLLFPVGPAPTKTAYREYQGESDTSILYVQDIATGVRKAIANNASPVRFTPDEGTLLYLQDGGAFAQKFVYVADLATNTTTLVSMFPNGSPADARDPDMSANGKVVAFWSNDALVAGDTNNFSDIYVRNLSTNTTQRISIGDSGAEPNDAARAPRVSADGTKVIFQSRASNLVDNDINGKAWDVFVKDLTTGDLTLISESLNGGSALGQSTAPRFSADGSYVLFDSTAPDLAVAEATDVPGIYRYDLKSESRLLFDVASSGKRVSFTAGDGSAASVENTVPGALVKINHIYDTDGDYQARLAAAASGEPETVKDIAVKIRGYADAAVNLVGGGGIDMMLLSAFNDQADGGDGDDILVGAKGNDTLLGGLGNDRLDGGRGEDTLRGGGGNDVFYIDNLKDRAFEDAVTGIDTVISTVSFTLGENIELLTLTGTANTSGTGNFSANTLIGNAGKNTLSGLLGNDTLDGGTGADRLIGGFGDDTYIVDNMDDVVVEDADGGGNDTVRSSITFTLAANVETLILTGALGIYGNGNESDNMIIGNGAANNLQGFGGNDTLIGGKGNDVLTGDSGNDTMIGGDGDDTYFYSVGDTIIETSDGGTDTVFSGTTITLAAGLENVRLRGKYAPSATGNDVANELSGTRDSNVLKGLSGDDILVGNGGDDRLEGGDGNDTLIGSAGRHTAIGGAGNDTYVIDSSDDLVVEDINGGIDTVEANSDFTLSANVERIVLLGTAAINATGNALGNKMTGNEGKNVLIGGSGDDIMAGFGGDDVMNGGTGADRMIGGAGNDTYQVGVGDTIREEAGGGKDTVIAGISYQLADALENLVLIGTGASAGVGNNGVNAIKGNEAANRILGRDGDDTLSGAGGDDLIEGGRGFDTLNGGAGADTFVYRTTLESGDTIINFEAGLDTFAFSASGFGSGLTAGALSPDRFVSGAGAVATQAKAQFIYDSAAHILSFDADGTGSGSALQIAGLTNAANLTASDFILIG